MDSYPAQPSTDGHSPQLDVETTHAVQQLQALVPHMSSMSRRAYGTVLGSLAKHDRDNAA